MASPTPGPIEPRIERIFIRDLSPHSYGNALGLGMADVVHDRLLAKIDWDATLVNSLTANTPTAIRTPIHFPTDRECLERISTRGGPSGSVGSDLRLDQKYDGTGIFKVKRESKGQNRRKFDTGNRGAGGGNRCG